MTKRTVFRAKKTSAKNKNGDVIHCMIDNCGNLFDPKTREYLGDEWKENRLINPKLFSFLKITISILIVVFSFCYFAPISKLQISWILLFSIPVFSILCTVAITIFIRNKKYW
jgi:hypothetical protein